MKASQKGSMLWQLGSVLFLFSTACVQWEVPDLDGDGIGYPEDCDDLDAGIGPDAEEVWYDGIDQNCDGNDSDHDGDGEAAVEAGGTDCWDNPEEIPEGYVAVTSEGFEQPTADQVNTAAEDTWYDGVDSDCDESNDFDQDGDGYDSADHPNLAGEVGEDCIDGEVDETLNPAGLDPADINPGVEDDACYDGTNADCDADEPDVLNSNGDWDSDYDCDNDGWMESEECDDSNPDIEPNDDPDAWYDCVDANCDGNDGDQDGDGYVPDVVFFEDGSELDYTLSCDWETVNPGIGSGDCADDPADPPTVLTGFDALSSADVYPGADDTWYDGVDANCLEDSDFDQDVDGYESSSDAQDNAGTVFGTDCDDLDSEIYPSHDEDCGTVGVDDNCDGDTNDEGAIGCITYYWDADNDLWGIDDDACHCTPEGNYRALVQSDYDCDDADATVYPTASEICDGQDNDCDGNKTFDETDNDGDAYVECALDSGGWDGSSAVTGFEDCDDTDATIYPSAEEICDGQDNDCDSNLPSDEVDNDTDGYVECEVDSGGWDGTSISGGEDCDDGDSDTWPGIAPNDSFTACMTDVDGDGFGDISASSGVTDGTDCDDSDPDTWPGATEYCDGHDDNCDGEVDEDSASDSSTWYADTDGDGYGDSDDSDVDCYVPNGYVSNSDDCDDDESTIYPSANELCDGQDNDCNSVIPSDELDNDGDAYVECSEDSGGWDGSSQVTGWEDCDDTDDDTHPDVASNESNSTDCMTDADGDDWGDSSPATGVDAGTDCDDGDNTVYPGASELCDGQLNNCDSSLPGNEVDNDLDGFVECSIDSGGWDGSASMQGDDCDDGEATLYPGAGELCDGQINNCNTSTLASNEIDDDSDGFVECSMDSGGWDGSGSMDGDDCDDDEATIYPGASELCDGQLNNCDSSLPGNEVDNDSDGYVECSVDSGGWDGTGAKDGDDCDDGDSTVYPGATELCDGQINNCDTSSLAANEIDNDSDGYVECALDSGGWDGSGSMAGDDCDDAQASTNPGADEYCDSVDNDCDGDTDEDSAVDASTWYLDSDSDSYGNSASATDACNQPSSYVTDSTDCDDSDNTVYPGASELCDGQLNDCDSTLSANEVDNDSDGYVECSIDSEGWDAGGTMDGDDCDDADSSVNPGASEVCDSSDTDEDCNGLADDADSGASGQTDWTVDADSDGYGDEDGTALSQCDAPSGYVADNTDCDDTDSGINPGESEVEDSTDQDCDDMVDEDFYTGGELVISEIMPKPDSGDDEWFELHNPGLTDLYVDGLEIKTNYGGGPSFFVAPDTLVVPAGGYAVLCKQDDSLGNLCDYIYGTDVNDSSAQGVTYSGLLGFYDGGTGGWLYVYMDGTTIDEIHYENAATGSNWPATRKHQSQSLASTALDDSDNDDGANWCNDNTSDWGDDKDRGTPGSADTLCVP